MIIFGPADACIFPIPSNMMVINFTSLMNDQSIPQLISLLPQVKLCNISDPNYQLDFDINYANYILQNPLAFIEFMAYIIIPWKQGYNVYVMIDKWGNEGLDMLNESIIKFIQQRYGFEPYRVYCIGDTREITTEVYYQDHSCTMIGLSNLDLDIYRYEELTIRKQILEEVGNGDINETNYIKNLSII